MMGRVAGRSPVAMVDDPLRIELASLVAASLCVENETYQQIVARIGHGNLTRAENRESHFSVYFLPHRAHHGEVFLAHHRKSGLWLSPGGHVEPGETVIGTLVREVQEELGLQQPFSGQAQPFLLTVTDVMNPAQECRTHFDV